MRILKVLLAVLFLLTAAEGYSAEDCASFLIDTPASAGGLDPVNLNLTTDPVSEADLLRYSPYELRFIRNSVFAYYGRSFKDPVLIEYFSRFPWYQEDSTYSDSRLSPVAKKNVERILAIESYPRGAWSLSRFGVAPLPSDAVLCGTDDDGQVWFVPGLSPSALLSELAKTMCDRDWRRVDGNDAWMRYDCGKDYTTESTVAILSRWVGFNTIRTQNGTRIRAEYSEEQNPSGQERLCGAFQIVNRRDLSGEEKKKELRVMQDSIGQEAFVTVLRYLPLYDPEKRRVVTYDRFVRDLAADYGTGGNAPIDRDPVGSTFSIITNPSLENVARQTGLSWK